jgi:hypothetical protein
LKLSRLNLILLIILIILLLSISVARHVAPRNMVEKITAIETFPKTRLDVKDIMANISQINVYDRVHADLNDWERLLEDIRKLINMGEIGDEDAFPEARKKIAGMLGEIKQTRHFLAIKQQEAISATADVEALFEDEQPGVSFGLPESEPREQ